MIQYYDWLPEFEAMKSVAAIPNELALVSFSDIIKEVEGGENYIKQMRAPHKFDFIMMIIHFAGSVKLKIDMVEYDLTEPNNFIRILPGQIVTIESVSADCDAHVVVMSHRFVENLLVYINGSVSINHAIKFGCVERVSESEMNAMGLFIAAIRRVLQNDDNPYRLQVIQHIIMAIFYSSDKLRDMKDNEPVYSSADHLSRKFLGLVKENFRKERQLKFYADALCITPRYLSRVVKECTGSSAADWIERYVVLEARALLKSTNMTIQQISDYLNFPSQTFFGKYFKRRAGMSPKEYRRLG